MSWLHPEYLWALLGGPVAAALFFWAAWRRRDALRRFGDAGLLARLAASVSPRRRRWKAAGVVLALLLVGLTLAGPRFGTRLREVKREGIDLVIALDVSMSMLAEDVAPNRLDRARNEIKKLLDGLEGDRVGLVIFAGDAFVQCPLTTDYGAVRLFLDVADPSMLPTPGTDFSAALRTAMKAFEVNEQVEDQPASRALLIVSDGENHAEEAAAVVAEARRSGIVIFTAGVGETVGAPIPLYSGGQRTGYKKDNRGELVRTRLEEASLEALAADGAYFRIARTSSSLPQLTAALDRLQKAEFAKEEFEEYEERYQWPLALALLLLAAEHLTRDRRKGGERFESVKV